MKRFLLAFFGSLGLGCKRAPSEPLVARYKDRYLTQAEALSRLAVPAGADTAALLRAYGAEWLRQQALADTAYALLPELRRQVEAQVQEYRTHLLIAYLSRLFAEKVMRQEAPSDSALLRQYEKQPEAFRATAPFYRYRWVKLPDTWLAQRELAQHLRAPDSIWQAWLKEKNYPGQVVSQWQLQAGLDSLQAFFPVVLTALLPGGVAQTRRIEADGPYLLVFQLTGLILPGQTLPFELVRDQLRNLYLQQQLHAWLSAFEDTVYQRALARPDVDLY
ncbi:MAG: hypothetical protein ABDH91_06745 [Bacteroidia bacterium]